LEWHDANISTQLSFRICEANVYWSLRRLILIRCSRAAKFW